MHHHPKTRWAIVVLFLLAFSKMGHAQGSPYDNIGFGLPVRSGNAVEDALGGTGVAMDASRTVNDLNPADWTWITRTRFGASLHYDLSNATQPGYSQDVQQNIQFSGASFAAPVWNQMHAVISLGYVPLTNASNDINITDSTGTRNYIIRGGTNLVFGGVAARPIPSLAFGARLDLVTGDIRHIDEVTYTDTTAGTGQFERDYIFYGVRPTLGFEIIGDSIADALSGVMIGASYSFATKLNSTYETITTPITSTLDTTVDEGGVGRYPASLSAGISVHLSRRYRAEADYFAQNFSSAYVYAPQAISSDTVLGSSNRIAVGIERLPNVSGEFGSSSGFDRWGLRLGFSYCKLPILPPTNIRLYPSGTGGINELSVSAGFGIPISLETLLNLSVVAGQRQPVNTGSAPKETFVRIGADVSFSEQWFVPMRRQ